MRNTGPRTYAGAYLRGLAHFAVVNPQKNCIHPSVSIQMLRLARFDSVLGIPLLLEARRRGKKTINITVDLDVDFAVVDDSSR